MEYISAKTIMSKVRYNGNQWFGIDYNMNLYRGCNHGCIYCDSRSEKYRIENFDRVRIKKDCILTLERELRKKKEKGVVGIGAMSDSYNKFEKEHKITRQALELLNKYNYGVSLETKSDLITRDVDILKKIVEKNNCIIKFTITTFDDELGKIIEPFVSSSSERFKALKELSSEGIFTGILLMPLLPYINDTKENILNMVREGSKNGAKFIYPGFGVTLRDIQKEYYLEKIERYFPKEAKLFKENYSHNYMNNIRNSREIWKVFTEECKKYNILYKMEDIIKEYKKDDCYPEQISMF